MQPLTAQEPTEQAIAATNDGNVAAAATQDGTAGAGKEGGTDRQAGCWQRLKQQLDTLHSNSNAPLLDATTINNTVLCISDALQLPDELLVGFPGQLMKNLLDPYSITAGASSALKAEAPAGGEREQQQQRSQQQENVGRVSSVHAALQLWYQQLCVAVAACDEPQVMMLLQQLSQQA